MNTKTEAVLTALFVIAVWYVVTVVAFGGVI